MDEDSFPSGEFENSISSDEYDPVPTRTFTDKCDVLPDVGLPKHLQEAWKHQLLVDYTIQVGDKEFKVHKIVMACVSEYFRSMLTGDTVESQAEGLIFEGLDALAVSNIIEYIYTNSITGERAGPEEMLACAMYFQVTPAIEAAKKMLREKINYENCFEILATFETYSLEEDVDRTKKFIANNTDKIVKVLGKQRLMVEHLLVLNKYWLGAEWDLFLALKEWIESDYANRKEHLDSLMGYVRFGLLSPTELRAVTETTMYGDSDGPWHHLVEQAQKYHNLPIHQRVLDHSEQTQVRKEPAPTCFSADYDLYPDALYSLHKEKSWQEYNAHSCPKFSDEPDALIVVNNFLVCCYGSWYIFDPRTMTWYTIDSLEIARDEFALTLHENNLYVFGGLVGQRYQEQRATDVIEKYDFHTDTWVVIDSKLPQPLYAHDACTIDGSIYVLGGQQTTGGWSSRLDCLDVAKGTWKRKTGRPSLRATWKRKSDMDTPEYKGLHVLVFRGDKVIAMLYEDFRLVYYTPSTNQWTVCYLPSHLDKKLHWDSEGKVLAKGNILYLLDFKYDNDPKRQCWYKTVTCCCRKLTFEGNEPKIIMDKLNEYPIQPEELQDLHDDSCPESFCAMLAVGQQSKG